jgi:hypothetical protein
MNHRILVFYGSSHPAGAIRRRRFSHAGDDVALIHAKPVGLPMLERMYKEYPPGAAPQTLKCSPAKSAALTALSPPPC